jgi:hypothetical protein
VRQGTTSVVPQESEKKRRALAPEGSLFPDFAPRAARANDPMCDGLNRPEGAGAFMPLNAALQSNRLQPRASSLSLGFTRRTLSANQHPPSQSKLLLKLRETLFRRSFVKGHDFTGCRKTLLGKRFVSGHDFSRAANSAK